MTLDTELLLEQWRLLQKQQVEMRARLHAVETALIRVLEWPLPEGTVEDYALPGWLAREARATLSGSELREEIEAQ